ncbi:hypothetical protein [Butyrivibrio sp. FCS014]|uniref:hypothetical protein n=1 Tax=Butyrivibrio sp. FCS014 TaxID=1408304 RepID=UPI0004645361|nr:hypothetical protein [Butyrivibrio sp. FCS014]
MASYESGASGSGNVKEAAQVLGAVKEEGKSCGSRKKRIDRKKQIPPQETQPEIQRMQMQQGAGRRRQR